MDPKWRSLARPNFVRRSTRLCAVQQKNMFSGVPGRTFVVLVPPKQSCPSSGRSRLESRMKVNFAHLRERAQAGGWINFAVFDARSSSGTSADHSKLLA